MNARLVVAASLALALLPLAVAPTVAAHPLPDWVPEVHCPQVQWLDESVGPVRVTGGGCSVGVFVDGEPVLP